MTKYVQIFIAALTLVSCAAMSHRNPTTISLEESIAVLKRAESFAKVGDIDALCSMNNNSTMCQNHLRSSGGSDAIPTDSPEIVDSYIIPDQGSSLGGRVIVLKGTDGTGKPYTTGFLVFDQGGNNLVPLNPIYWSGIGISANNETKPSIPQP